MKKTILTLSLLALFTVCAKAQNNSAKAKPEAAMVEVVNSDGTVSMVPAVTNEAAQVQDNAAKTSGKKQEAGEIKARKKKQDAAAPAKQPETATKKD
jgi:cytoskeletal protein RodZ